MIRALHRTGVLAGLVRSRRARCVVLTYHGVVTRSRENHAYLDDNFPDVRAFDQQMAYVARHYRPVRLKDLLDCYQRGDPPPPRSITVTFDDGFANNYTVALPILRRYGIPCTVFLTTGLIDDPSAQLWTERAARALILTARRSVSLRVGGRQLCFALTSPAARDHAAIVVKGALKRMPPDERDLALEHVEDICGRPALQPDDAERYAFLSWQQVRTMADAGVEFGSHTVSHPIVSTLQPAQVAAECTSSKKQIEAQINRECYSFAYPNGSAADFRPGDVDVLKSAGYRCAFTNEGVANGAAEDLFALKRVNIVRRFDMPMFEAALSGVLHVTSRMREVADRLIG
jgi:peptidoglycan/xylan/chitin deacetylase (PgdA/CDA1 family)